MNKNLVIKTSRLFYALALIVYAIQQFAYADFRDVFFPPWQSNLFLLPMWAYIFGLQLLVSAAAIILGKKAREAALILGTVFLILFCFAHVPYELISEPHSSWHLGVWANALKELALAGGAFVIAGSYSDTLPETARDSLLLRLLKFIGPFGELFFSTTMICFGIGHFLYTEPISTMVPAWIPDHLSWTYFAGVALICSGAAIILDIRTRIIAGLLGLMILLWFIFLHLPSAIADPYVARGNELASAFDALAFSGIAFLIAALANGTERDELS